jgi:hypothetical protein
MKFEIIFQKHKILDKLGFDDVLSGAGTDALPFAADAFAVSQSVNLDTNAFIRG